MSSISPCMVKNCEFSHFSAVCHSFISGFDGHFRLSVNVVIVKGQIFELAVFEIYDMCHIFGDIGDISTSDFVSHIAVVGRR